MNPPPINPALLVLGGAVLLGIAVVVVAMVVMEVIEFKRRRR